MRAVNGALKEQIAQTVATVEAVLGQDTVGVYLYGSAVSGGLRPASDIDLLVVSRRRTTREEKQRLVDRLSPISYRRMRPAAWRPVELTIVVQSEVRPWRYPPRTDFQYGEWLRGEFEAGNLEPSPPTNPDLAVLITMVLLADTSLVGPPVADVLDPVPRRDLFRAMVSGIDALLADLDSDTRNVVLTLARIWSTLTTGAIRSKDDAADWALARLPEEHRAVLARARAGYLGGEDEGWDGMTSLTRVHAAYVVRQIRGSYAEISFDAADARAKR